nr:uncharacterized protein LOC113691920 [Coffea arabica]
MLRLLKEVVVGSGRGLRQLPYNIGQPHSSARGPLVPFSGTTKFGGLFQVASFSSGRSIWKGSFVDAFLMKKKMRKNVSNMKIWSRRSTIWPELVDSTVRIYNGKTFVRCKITEAKVGHKFGEFAVTRKRRPSRPNSGPVGKKGKK